MIVVCYPGSASTLRTMTGARPILRYPPMPVYCRQHGLGLFDALVMLTEGEPWPCRLTKARQFQAPDQLLAGIVEDGKVRVLPGGG